MSARLGDANQTIWLLRTRHSNIIEEQLTIFGHLTVISKECVTKNLAA